MAKDWYFYDNAGARRRVTTPYFYDNGNARRRVQAGYFYDSAGNRRQFFSSVVLSGTLLAENFGTRTGFLSVDYGSITPPLQFGGGVVHRVDTANASNNFRFAMEGYASDPGRAQFASLAIAGGFSLTLIQASAAYSYAAGIATWQWAPVEKFVDAVSYPLTITL
jgi:hypothetical protein